jgi:hypothetical protein
MSGTTTVMTGPNFQQIPLAQVTNQSVATNLTAIGSTRATSLGLTSTINNVTTAAAGTGVTLPPAASVGIGATVVIFNNGANLIQVYGAGSDTIDGVAGATGVPLTNATRCEFYVITATSWISAKLGVVSS